jgi:antitoxin FitA
MGAAHASLGYGAGMGRNIQIRDVPDEVHRVLATRAASAGLSLTAYLRAELTRVAERPPVAEVLARAAARSGGARLDDIVAAVRSGRDRDEP